MRVSKTAQPFVTGIDPKQTTHQPGTVSPDATLQTYSTTQTTLLSITCMMILFSSILSWPSPSFNSCILRRASRSPASTVFSLLISTSNSAFCSSAFDNASPTKQSLYLLTFPSLHPYLLIIFAYFWVHTTKTNHRNVLATYKSPLIYVTNEWHSRFCIEMLY